MSDVKWIKISTGIFDDEKILLIESLPKSDAILTIWFKLLCLAGKTNNGGYFVLTDNIPYTNEMLSKIFRRKKSVVDLAIKTFQEFGMIEIIDGVITIPKWDEHQSLQGFENRKEYMREYMKERRSKQKVNNVNVNSKPNVNLLEEDKEEDKDKEEDINKKKSKKEVNKIVYYPNDEILDKAFSDYVAMRKQIKKPLTDRATELAIKKLNELSAGDNDTAIKIIEQSIMNSWQGLFPLKDVKTASGIDWSKV